jgi:hypothetical protein
VFRFEDGRAFISDGNRALRRKIKPGPESLQSGAADDKVKNSRRVGVIFFWEKTPLPLQIETLELRWLE